VFVDGNYRGKEERSQEVVKRNLEKITMDSNRYIALINSPQRAFIIIEITTLLYCII